MRALLVSAADASVAVLAAAADAVLVAHQAYPAKIAGNPKA